jgi:branched-chain amino acid transport system permease protein
MLRVVIFSPGALYMLGARGALVALEQLGLNFWVALALVPIVLGVVGMLVERLLVHRLTDLDPLYNFLLTFGLALILQNLVELKYGVASQPYDRPALIDGSVDLGLFTYPRYQVFVLVFSFVVSALVWLVLARTRIGMIVRGSTERPELTSALGINVGLWITPVFGFGIYLAGLAGVLAAPMRAVTASSGRYLVIGGFAVVVIGGRGAVGGAVGAGYLIGMLTAVGNYYVPALSNSLVFILMALVLLVRPAGLFGREESAA